MVWQVQLSQHCVIGRVLTQSTSDFLSHFNNTLNSPSTPLRPGTHTCPPSFHPRPIVAPVPLLLPPWVHVRARVWFSQCLPLFDCHSLAWVHGKPAVYFLTLTGYLCRHPTPVQPPPGPSRQGDVLAPSDNGKLSSFLPFFPIHASGFVCRHDNDTLRDTLCEDDSHRATHHAMTHHATTA